MKNSMDNFIKKLKDIEDLREESAELYGRYYDEEIFQLSKDVVLNNIDMFSQLVVSYEDHFKKDYKIERFNINELEVCWEVMLYGQGLFFEEFGCIADVRDMLEAVAKEFSHSFDYGGAFALSESVLLPTLILLIKALKGNQSMTEIYQNICELFEANKIEFGGITLEE